MARLTSTIGVSWKASEPMTGAATWPVMATGDQGRRIHLGVGQTGDEIGGPRPAGRDAHADPASAARVALGGEAAPLLVPRQNGAQLSGKPRQRLVDRHRRPAWVGEYDLDAVVDQTLNQDIGTGQQV
jgi:hypothetical protein